MNQPSTSPSRRQFLSDVGAGMVVASVGSALAADLGFSTAFAQTPAADRLNFGPLEELVTLMQETPPDRIIAVAVERLRNGTMLRDLAGAVALANARAFGGEDYVGFHTMMAIAPSVHMSGELPNSSRALPILKVMHRNATRLQGRGRSNDTLRPVTRADGDQTGTTVRESVRGRDLEAAERRFAAVAAQSPEAALNGVIDIIADSSDVHRVVMPYRSWDLCGIIGREQAGTLLRQSVHYCVNNERYLNTNNRPAPAIRAALIRAIDQHRLDGRTAGTRMPDDDWVLRLSETIFRGTPDQAADAAGAALAEGVSPDAIHEAISLAVNQLVLRDSGRRQNEVQQNKPLGSVHGDSIGVHACDSANAWRNLARAGNDRTKMICTVVGAWQAADDRGNRGGDFLTWTPYPRDDVRREVENVAQANVLTALGEAIRAREQPRACALTARHIQLGLPERELWRLFLDEAIRNDGALHAEKFYRTTTEEHTAARPAVRARYLIGLARVTASASGYAAPGVAEATRLLES